MQLKEECSLPTIRTKHMCTHAYARRQGAQRLLFLSLDSPSRPQVLPVSTRGLSHFLHPEVLQKPLLDQLGLKRGDKCMAWPLATAKERDSLLRSTGDTWGNRLWLPIGSLAPVLQVWTPSLGDIRI